MMNYTVTIKKHSQHHFHIGTNLRNFLGCGWSFLRPITKNGILLQYHRCKPKFHHLRRSSLKSYHKHLHSWQDLYWHQHDFVSDLHPAGAAQIWLQPDGRPSFQSESHDIWFLKFHIPLLLHKWSYDWNGPLSELLGCFLHFFMLKVILKVHCPQLKHWPSLKCLYHSWVCVLLMASSPNACFNILKVSKNIFPNLKQNLPSNHFAHDNHPFLIA